MAITIDLPASVEAELRARFDNLDAVAKVGLAVEAYRTSMLSLGQFADLLGISQHEADALLKERGIMLDLTPEQIAEERNTLQVG